MITKIKMLTKKCMIPVAVASLGSPLAQAADKPALPREGHFIGYATVASIASTAGDACPVALGHTFTGILQLPGTNGKGSIFRTAVTLPSGMVVEEDAFRETFEANVPSSGTFRMGFIGKGPPNTSRYRALFSPLDAESFAGTLTLIYQNPAGAPGVSAPRPIGLYSFGQVDQPNYPTKYNVRRKSWRRWSLELQSNVGDERGQAAF